MNNRKHIKRQLKLFGVFLFIFLNCLFVSTPFISASSLTSRSQYLGYPVQNQNGSEPEKEACTVKYLNEQTVYSLNRRNKQDANAVLKKEHHLQLEHAIAEHNDLTNYSGSFLALIKPAYYTFLFLYNLF